MSFGGMNFLAIVAAAVAAFLFGAAYYGLLGSVWRRAARLEAAMARPGAGVLAVTFAAELVMAWVLAGTLGHLGVGQVTLKNGLISALFVWAGFMATTVVVNHRYEGFGWDLVGIDAGHWLGVALIMGAVIGGMGV